MLTIKHKRLPLKIADKISEAGDIIATEVFFDDDKNSCVRITHDLPMGELTDIVCNTISAIYDTDVSVSNTEPKALYNLRYYARRRGYVFAKNQKVATVRR